MRNKVLVVDDMELNRELLAEILQDEYDIITAENGKLALECLLIECAWIIRIMKLQLFSWI